MAEYIEREKVYHKLTGVCDGYCHAKMCKFTEYMLEEIEDIPIVDVQPVKQWVKLHDKHPDTEGFYLVCDQYGECEVVEYLPDIKSWFTHKIKGEIQYWMPLPEPPKDGDT